MMFLPRRVHRMERHLGRGTKTYKQTVVRNASLQAYEIKRVFNKSSLPHIKRTYDG